MSESGSVGGDPRVGAHAEEPRDGRGAASGRRRGFDPRFSPAFQPGYDPRVHRETPPAAPLRGEPQQDWTLSGGMTGGRPEQGGIRRAGASVAPERGAATGSLDDVPVFAVPEEPGEPAEVEPELEAEPVAWWRLVNPWLVVLWVLGIGIILFAFQFANLVFDASFRPNPNDPGGYLVSMLPQMVIFGLPSVICLGLAVFVTPFVILAARWRRG